MFSSRRHLPDPIPWDEDGTYWYDKPGGGGYRIHRSDITVQNAINITLRNASQHHPPRCDRNTVYRGVQFLAYQFTEPPADNIYPFLDIIMQESPKVLALMLEEEKKKGGNLSDFLFVVDQSMRRDWMHDCPICLEKQVGTACTCGYTEVAMFRPCGHTMCSQSCLEQYIHKQTGRSLPPSTWVGTDNKGKKIAFRRVGMVDVTAAKNFPCPICRTNVERTIKADSFLNIRDQNTKAYQDLEQEMQNVYRLMFID